MGECSEWCQRRSQVGGFLSREEAHRGKDLRLREEHRQEGLGRLLPRGIDPREAEERGNHPGTGEASLEREDGLSGRPIGKGPPARRKRKPEETAEGTEEEGPNHPEKLGVGGTTLASGVPVGTVLNFLDLLLPSSFSFSFLFFSSFSLSFLLATPSQLESTSWSSF
ncbi:hypothetical protein IE53DRAFT_412855 [Violaceomyces palustris]|uniref:Uncharacterized protein n=1 Tax=Violaceomyces palustris TaxID=1673888 RepID=A0ACD0NPG0_9BASI|nr:hypothetical protein IE53DRAFT_412855 [Violaceomyces palustris]